jgi:hypothetical protein
MYAIKYLCTAIVVSIVGLICLVGQAYAALVANEIMEATTTPLISLATKKPNSV